MILYMKIYKVSFYEALSNYCNRTNIFVKQNDFEIKPITKQKFRVMPAIFFFIEIMIKKN